MSPYCRRRWKRLCRSSSLPGWSERRRKCAAMTKRPQVKLGRKPVVHILIAGTIVFLDETDAARPLDGRTRAFAVEEGTVGTASGEIDAQIFADRGKFEAPSSSSREARRLARTGLDATICDLGEMRKPLFRWPARSSRVACGEWISMSLCVPIASRLVSSTHRQG